MLLLLLLGHCLFGDVVDIAILHLIGDTYTAST